MDKIFSMGEAVLASINVKSMKLPSLKTQFSTNSKSLPWVFLVKLAEKMGSIQKVITCWQGHYRGKIFSDNFFSKIPFAEM